MKKRFEFIVVGGGIAGASVSYRLIDFGETVLLEMEEQPGYHSTGRSAAQYTELYGNASIRALVRLSNEFFTSPPNGFTESPILMPRGAMFIATGKQRHAIDTFLDMARQENCLVRELDVAGARDVVPVLRASAFESAVLELESTDIDVHALHGGYLRGFRAGGGEIVTNAEARMIERVDGNWRVETPAGEFEAPVLVNAAGAWGDVIARRAGVEELGLQAKRRTVILFEPPQGENILDWPLVIDAEENWYFKPEAGVILASPADETPTDPCDAQPEDLDIAIVADAIERMTTMEVGRILNSRAGLRTFVKDKSPVVGFAPDAPGFFWLVGQGGYGIETSPAISVVAANLIVRGRLPVEFTNTGITDEVLSPRRLLGI